MPWCRFRYLIEKFHEFKFFENCSTIFIESEKKQKMKLNEKIATIFDVLYIKKKKCIKNKSDSLKNSMMPLGESILIGGLFVLL